LSLNELQFLDSGPQTPAVVVRGTFLDLAEQPKVEQRSESAPVLGQSYDDDEAPAEQEFTRKELAYSWCERGMTSCDDANGEASDIFDSKDPTTYESGSDTTSCGENEDASVTISVSSDADEEAGDTSISDGVQDHEVFDFGYGEFEETPAIDSDMSPSRWRSVTDLDAEPAIMSSPRVPGSLDDTEGTALKSEVAGNWADLDFEESVVIEPEPTYLSPTAPPSDSDLAKDLTMDFDTASGICSVHWKLPAKYFNSTNTTKTSQVFKVFFGQSLNCKILLQPRHGGWKKSKGEGKACLKIDDELPDGTVLSYRFILGHCLDPHGLATVHDFSKSNMKYTDDFMNFIPPAGEEHVCITAEFLRAEEPGWQ